MRAADKSSVGNKILNPFKPVNRIDLIENSKSNDVTYSMDALQDIERLPVSRPGVLDDIHFNIPKYRIMVFDKGKVR